MNKGDGIRIVLMAENEPFVRAATSFISRHADMKIVGIFNGEEASLKRTQSLRPEVILLDVDMVRQNGLVTINHLRALLPKVAIIALSLIDSQGFRRATLAAGADGLIHKLNLGTELFPAIYKAAYNGRIDGNADRLETEETGLSEM
ncbi:MAG TPA: response regulator transcription factor [Anaerolineales bacterium]|nr:response regulator transcription factor [Anaerolineales bacterium]